MQLTLLPQNMQGEAGDKVIYAGHGIGDHLSIVASMFPTMKFLVYDANPNPWFDKQVADRSLPSNIYLRQIWFKRSVAEAYITNRGFKYDASKTLLISYAQNVWITKTDPFSSGMRHLFVFLVLEISNDRNLEPHLALSLSLA